MLRCSGVKASGEDASIWVPMRWLDKQGSDFYACLQTVLPSERKFFKIQIFAQKIGTNGDEKGISYVL